MVINVPQLRAARALLGWSQDQLAEKSEVSKPTIARLELAASGEIGGYASTQAKLKAALEYAGVIFVEENGEGPGVRLRKKTQPSMPKPSGPATDAVEAMDAAIEEHKTKRKR